jgi:hypothetical protein
VVGFYEDSVDNGHDRWTRSTSVMCSKLIISSRLFRVISYTVILICSLHTVSRGATHLAAESYGVGVSTTEIDFLLQARSQLLLLLLLFVSNL